MRRLAVAGVRLAGGILGLVLLLAPASAMAQQADWPEPIHDDKVFYFLLFDQIEFVSVTGSDPIAWDVEGWIGGDYNRIWIKSEGERTTRGEDGELEVQGLYSRLIAPFWDFQVGVRYDRKLGPGADLSRAHLVIGLEGLAPYWFELEPVVFISDDGDVSARLKATYDMLLTQRLILQPEIEVNVAAQTTPQWGVGSGLSNAAAELRLRYELRRELAPYVGVSWFQRFGRTADLARSQGEHVANLAVLGGFRIWF